MRYRKRVKICKGLNVNFSLSGPSVTVGGKGCSVNFGKKGTYLNTGIPGTGFYDRHKLSGSKPQKNKSEKYVERAFKIHYADDASIEIRDEAGRLVTDASILKQVKASPEYKQEIERMSQARLEEINGKIDQVVNIYKSSCKVYGIDIYKKAISDIKNNKYTIQEYDTPIPTEDSVRIELQEKGKKEISTLQFWKKNQLVEEYVQKNLQDALQKELAAWENEKVLFEKEETEKSLKFQEECEQNYIYQTKILNNDENTVNEVVEQWLNTVEFPFDFSLGYGFRNNELLVDLDLPEIEDMPLEYAQKMANGTVKVKSRAKKDIKEDYFKCVLGLSIFFATHLASCAFGMEQIIISAYTQRPDNKGLINDDYIYSVKFDREKLSTINLSDDISKIFFSFENICDVKSDKTFKTIIPFE